MLLVRIAVDSLALLAAALLVPGITLEFGDEAAEVLLVLVVVAVPFALVDQLLDRRSRVVSVPMRLMTFGLGSVVVAALLLLGVAGVLDAAGAAWLTIGSFPPELDAVAVAWALAGGVIIAAITTLLRFAIREP